MYIASQQGQAEALTLLLEKGADVNQVHQNGLLGGANDGMARHLSTLSHTRGSLSNTSMSSYCVTSSNQAMNNGETPVCVAALEGHTEILMILIKHGGNVNQADNVARTPLSMAAQNGHTAALKILLHSGGDIHMPDSEGCTPAWIAAEGGHTEALHTLLKAGANARTAEWMGTPALHIAASAGHLPVVKVLAEYWPADRYD